MNTKKAPTSAATLAREDAEAAALASASISDSQSITTGVDRQPGFIESLLIREGAHGAESAIRTDRLVMLAGLSDKRKLQAQIEQERARGALILSKCDNDGGYYLPATRAELVDFERTLRRRALGTLRTLKGARSALGMCEGQEVIFNAEKESGGEV